VVWFGEMLPPSAVSAALAACSCDVFLSIGTSALVYPAAGFVEQARAQGAFTVEVNPEATPATSRVDLALAGRADELLPLVDASLSDA
jgi:NAD-dependent deacetylase